MTKEIKISGARGLTNGVTIKITPSEFVSDDILHEDAMTLNKVLRGCIPVRTYEYLLKLFKTEWEDSQQFVFTQAENNNQQIKQKVPIKRRE